jgi:hypothetical protein
MKCLHCLKGFKVENETNIQLLIDRCEIVNHEVDGKIERVIHLDTAQYGFDPIEHPTITKVLEWARSINVPINDYDELYRIIGAQKAIVTEN